jgi:hypothetical protein
MVNEDPGVSVYGVAIPTGFSKELVALNFTNLHPNCLNAKLKALQSSEISVDVTLVDWHRGYGATTP